MNIEQLYRDFGIPYATEGHKHTRDGWINIACPFCTGNAGLHLGFHLEDEYYVCWRCGGHSITDTLTKSVRHVLQGNTGHYTAVFWTSNSKTYPGAKSPVKGL